MLKNKLLIGLMLALLSTTVTATRFGMNTRNLDATSEDMINELKQRNLIANVRVNLSSTTNVPNGIAKAKLIRAAGGTITGVILGLMQYDSTCSTNYATLETNSYNETFAIINNFKDVIQDYEFLNESPNRSWLQAEIPIGSGQNASQYIGKPCYASLIAGLKGMSNALATIRASSGIPLRSILGTVSRDWGFIAYAISQGVSVDVVGFHVYPGNGQTALDIDPWYNFGTGNLFTALAQFGKPAHINEFNCQEHYLGFDNVVGSANTIACNNALKKHLTPMLAQTTVNIEYIDFYEMLDDTSKVNPEDRFGLMYTIWNPKMQLATATAFAGGFLSKTQKDALIAGGYVTCKDLLFYRDRAKYWPMTITLSNPVYKSAVNLATTCQ